MDAIVERTRLPGAGARFDAERHAAKTSKAVRERLLAQAMLAFRVRQRLSFEVASLHGISGRRCINCIESPSGTLLCAKGLV
jgi:hypothetical protein